MPAIEELEAREEIDDTVPGPCPGRELARGSDPNRTSERGSGEAEDEQTGEKPSFHKILHHLYSSVNGGKGDIPGR